MLQGLLTPWGLVRYRWIALELVKDAAGASTVLVVSVVLSVCKPFGLRRGRRR